MKIPGTLLFGILVASFASSVLASAIPDFSNNGGGGGGGGGNNGGGGGGNNGGGGGGNNGGGGGGNGGGGGGGNNGGGGGDGGGGGGGGGGYDTCADGSRRNPATAASQAGPLPYCASYVSTSISTVIMTATTTVKGVVTKSDSKETNGKTTLVKTTTVTGTPHTVTSTIPVTVTAVTTFTTTTTAPVVVVTSVMQVKRDRDPPKPASTSTKCSCIVLFSTTTITSTKTQSALTTTTTTILKSSLQTITTTTTSTINPTTTLTIPVTTTTTTTQTTTQTIASTSTVIHSIPSACAGDLTVPLVNLAANTIPHPEQTYTSIYSMNGIILLDITACCTACYTLSGCYAFGFGNFNPSAIPPQLGGSYCQVFVGISGGVATPNTCTAPERVNFITYRNPGQFGAGSSDFFYAATGPCAAGIDVSTIG